VFWGKEGETSVLFPGMKTGNVYVSADGSLKMKGLVVENSGKICFLIKWYIFFAIMTFDVTKNKVFFANFYEFFKLVI
jgi:hypothetical protein